MLCANERAGKVGFRSAHVPHLYNGARCQQGGRHGPARRQAAACRGRSDALPGQQQGAAMCGGRQGADPAQIPWTMRLGRAQHVSHVCKRTQSQLLAMPRAM